MRWMSTLLALAATGALQVNAQHATILTFPSSSDGALKTVPKQQLFKEEARLILKLRMQSSVASVLGAVDANTVDHLNQFADSDSTLFGGYGGKHSTGKSIVILEGVEQHTELQSSQPNHIIVPQVSSQFIDADLLESFGEGGDRGEYCAFNDDAGVASMKAQNAQECLSQDPMLAGKSGLFARGSLAAIDSVEDWTSTDSQTSILKLSFKDSSHSAAGAQLLRSLIAHLTELSASSQREITAVILPLGSTSASLRRGAKSVRSSIGNHNFARSTPDSPLLSTLAPVCHSSNSSCTEATRNCSGHGSCYLKFGSGVEGTTGNCYACKCQQTTVKNSDGTTRSVQWGGSACQKKDISSPFFLIASVTLLVILLVGSAIGMLFSMGAQKLPSTISAGVSNPRSQM
ncbi:unnamed protein product [Penicillium salamii]|uniref:Vacuolar sorting protein Vps3844 C-terminal domain-containing protein n=1 Tax=Penicillium salamii TaxID=1612424 RepID=A0A9W4JYF1_9EURO|nr:unnamed protein product [Penicillium salamii]CAG8186215.1 unnamed protein product [Penicillium salamii]CAG8195322.1 unnamed protein product [Penicillium salamii]CAG8253765.1 unnamed protein product [Penicillium salamii]CAG8306774.1 unnamed protein product [Penicillium salamii]